jgi:type VI protein secretion system component VasK
MAECTAIAQVVSTIAHRLHKPVLEMADVNMLPAWTFALILGSVIVLGIAFVLLIAVLAWVRAREPTIVPLSERGDSESDR